MVTEEYCTRPVMANDNECSKGVHSTFIIISIWAGLRPM